MIESGSVTDRLRRAFAADERSRTPGRPCPEPERIWNAIHGHGETEERREVVDHIAECAACAADWRVAMAPAESMAAPEALPVRARAGARSRWPWLVAAAAALLVVTLVAVDRMSGRGDAPPVYRAGEVASIRSLVDPDETLPRDRALLRWSSAGEEARYSIEIDTLGLEPVSEARGLAQPEYQVPPEDLAGLPPRATLHWRVEARLPDGSRVASPAFLTRIE
jgi:hypothetical protein